MARLDGKVALITGAGSGIGEVAAELLRRRGGRRWSSPTWSPTRPRRVVADIVGAGRHRAPRWWSTSPTKDQVDAMVAAAVDTYGGLHVLFNNAGIFPDDDGGVLDTPPATWQKVMEVNLKGVWLGCRAAVPAMLDSGGGSIVNVASFVALMGAATAQIAYTASKGGVLALTRELAVEYARRGIRANSLCPGPDRDAVAGRAPRRSEPAPAPAGAHPASGGSAGRRRSPRRRCSSRRTTASFVTGSALVVDGGITAAYVTPEVAAGRWTRGRGWTRVLGC